MKFEWIIQEKIAAADQPKFEKDYHRLYQNGIRWIINLRENPFNKTFGISQEWLEGVDIKFIHIGTKDNTGFTTDQFSTIHSVFEESLSEKNPLLLHCAAGAGRTSTALIGLWMKHFKVSLNLALEELIPLRNFYGISAVLKKLGYTNTRVLLISDLQKKSLEKWEIFLKSI